jgi:hypothetical protein
MQKALLLWVGLALVGSACTQRMICPAYQSSFIYDKEALRKKFSYFKEDSTPKILTANKNKYLVAVPESYRKKLRNLQTVEMKPIYPVIPDSMKIDKEVEQLMAERDVIVDTTAAPADSVYAITKTKEKYNVDQDIYMWYFRDQLVLPDVRAAMEQKKESKDEAAQEGKGKKRSFFDLFKRKNKKDSLVAEPPAPDDSTATKTGGGLKGLFKKKNKDKGAPKPKEDKKKEPAKKEDDDDGF